MVVMLFSNWNILNGKKNFFLIEFKILMNEFWIENIWAYNRVETRLNKISFTSLRKFINVKNGQNVSKCMKMEMSFDNRLLCGNVHFTEVRHFLLFELLSWAKTFW